MADLQASTITGTLNVSAGSISPNPFTTANMPPGTILQVAGDSNNNLTVTTSQSGFQALIASLTPRNANSKIAVFGHVYGAASDDAHSWLEYRIGSGAWVRNTELNGTFGAGGGAAFADFSYARDDIGGDTNDAQTGGGTSVVFSPNTTQTVSVRVICSAENAPGFSLNIGRARDTTGYNGVTTKSTLVIMEIAG
jgi:hypothetical protein